MSIATRIESIEEHIEDAYNGLQGLGADLTGIDKNIENISMVLDDIYDSMPQVSGEGTSLTLDDTRVGKIKSTLKGNTSQTGTPTPSSPIPVNVVSGDNEIEVCGKNLFDKDNANYVNGWIDGTTMRLNTINGNRMFYIPCKPNTTYTISRSVITSSFRITTYDSTPFPTVTGSNVDYTVGSVLKNDNGTTLTITTSANAKYLIVHYGKIEDTNLNETLATIMVVKGNTAPTTYEPYSGNTYNIDLGVKNLIDFNRTAGVFSGNGTTFEETKYFPNMTRDSGTGSSCELVSYADNVLTIKGRYGQGVGFPIRCKPNQSYFVKATSSDSNARLWLSFYDNTGTYISGSSNDSNLERSATSPSNSYWVIPIFGVYGSSLTNVEFSDIKVLEGNKEQTISSTPIELCSSKDGTLRDYFLHDRTTDKWYKYGVIGEVAFSDLVFTEIGGNFSQFSTNGNIAMVYLQNDLKVTGNRDDVFCNLLKPYSNSLFGGSQTGINQYYNDTKLLLSVPFANVENFAGVTLTVNNYIDYTKNYIKSLNGNIYYILATPTTKEITYQLLIDQLNLLEKAMSKDGQTNISQVNNDLPFIISASALKEWQESTSLNSTLSMVNPLSLGNTLNTQEIDNNTQPIEADNIEPLEEEENEES